MQIVDAVLLKEIILSDCETTHNEVVTRCSSEDVTGGMQLKLTTASDIVKLSQGKTPVFICHISSPGAVNACLFGDFKGEQGTKIFL